MKHIPILIVLAGTIMPQQVLAETLTVHVEKAEPGSDPATAQPILTLTLTAESRAAIGAFTSARVGQRVRMRVGDTVLSEPFIREPITLGSLVISGQMTEESARTLADLIMKSGGVFEVDGVGQ